MKKLKLFLATLTMLVVGGICAWAQVTDVSNKLVASGSSWPTFSSEKTGNSDNAPWQGANVSLTKVKGACTLADADFKFAEVYYDKTTGSKYTVTQTVTGLDNGIYKFRIAAFARKENIWGDDNGKADANNVRLKANNSSTYITSNVMAYYELVTEVTDGTLTISISGVDDSNKSNWMGYTDASLLKLFSGSSYPADVKELVTNWDFTDCENDNFPGWTIDASNGNRWKNGDTQVEYWIGTASNGSFDYYQIVTGLPTGRYKLSASMWNSTDNAEGSVNGECGVYGTSNGTTVFAGVTVDTRNDNLSTYTTDELVVTNGELRLGVKNNTNMGARWFGVDWIKLIYCGPVVESGVYYLFDATNEVFASRGANSATRMNLDIYGIPVTWDNWSQRISYKDWPNTYLYFDNTTPAGSWIFTDASDNKSRFNFFGFAPGDGGYYLKDNNQTCFVKSDGNVTVPTTTQAEATIWVLKTKEEHDAIVANYPADNKTSVITAASLTSETNAADFETWLAANRAAKDKTSRVGTAKFTGSVGDWTWTGSRTNVSQGAVNYGTDYAEAYLYAGDWSQTISGLTNGIYKVTVNAFERPAGYAVCNTIGAEGYEPVTSYFEANGQKVQLKSWYSEKTGTNNPNNTGEAVAAFNSDKYKSEVYAYVSDGTLTLKLAKPSYSDGSWVLFNNVTLTYYDTDVDDADATSILSEAITTMGSPMKPSLYQALLTAKSTFDGSRTVPNYNALRAAIDNTETSIASYAAMNTNYLTPIANLLSSTNILDLSTGAYSDYLAYKAKYDNYTNAETADIDNETANSLTLYQGNGTRYTNIGHILMTTGWTINGNDAVANNSGFYTNTWSTENSGEAPAADFARPFYEMWVSSGSISAATLSRTITGLTANKAYSVTANVRVQGSSKVAGSITMEVVGGEAVDVTDGSQIGETARYIGSYTATGVTDGEGNLVLKFNVAANSNISWLAFRDLNYAESEAAVSNDFSALTVAINTAEDYNLGFEIGEYAPYNNIAGPKALAKAKSFDKTRYYISSVISAATSALSSVEWNVNSEKMNAFYDGTFAMQAPKNDGSNGTSVIGWTANNNIRTLVKSETEGQALYKATEGHSGMYVWNGADATYGETAGYTVPLHANQVYLISYKRGSWNSDGASTYASVSITGPENTTIPLIGESLYAYKYDSTDRELAQQSAYFVAPVDGNYVFVFGCSGNTVFTDLQLYSVDDNTLVFADGSVPTYAPGTYPSVKISRALRAGYWATAVYPFAVSGVDKIAVLDRYDSEKSIIGFSSADSSTPNQPFLMRSTAGASEISLSNVAVSAANVSNVTVNEEAASLIGSYSQIQIKSEATFTDYVLSNNVIYPVGTEDGDKVYIDPYRAYIKVATGGGEARSLTFYVDDEPTAIEGITLSPVTNGEVYNLNGQRVQVGDGTSGMRITAPRKGLYIQNGKKVIIK